MSEEINVIHSYSTLDTKVGKLCNGIYRHCWEIDDFVNKLDMKNGESLKSCTFTTKTKNSQTDWCIVLYPNGATPGSVGNLSLFLRRLSKYKLTLAVRFTFKILDGNDDTILEKGSQEKDKIYDRVNRNWGIEFITHSMLKAKGVGSGTEVLREAFKKKNCDYSDIVPISFYTHPPEGDRDSEYRDKINVISTPRPYPPWYGHIFAVFFFEGFPN